MKYHEFSSVYYLETLENNVEQFWHAINLWNERPNLLNKRVFGCEVLLQFKLKNISLADDIINIFQHRILNEVPAITADEIHSFLLRFFKEHITLVCSYDEYSVIFYVKRLLLRSVDAEGHQSDIEIAILDYKNTQATFFNVSRETKIIEKQIHYCYRIKYKQRCSSHEEDCSSNYIALLLEKENRNVCNENPVHVINWLKNKLLPKFVKWVEQKPINKKVEDTPLNKLNKGSLRLVNINEYSVLYQKLKTIYGKSFVKIWPESTDPLKYVYEDVAIATYLLLLWGHKKQNFIDLGCGNGLLVHILNSEGHNGLGIDVRSRKIWDLYPVDTVNLQVKTIVPTSDDSCLYPDADWLIGNHSDELTPWIPVLAAMSSYQCKFFLLPCCAYELNGQKYQRQNSSKSQYMDYLEHIVELSSFCGFIYEVDKLRIPSTKRICIVGDSRTYSIDKQIDKVNIVRKLIESKCEYKKDKIKPSNNEPISCDLIYGDFKPRSNEIKVRNCTQLDKNLITDLIALIAKKILNLSLVSVDSISSCDTTNVSVGSLSKKIQWNEGVPISLSDLAKSLPNDYLKKLKKECGGLQTLIKNHHYIFKIDKGLVSFRKPCSIIKKDNKSACFKAKRCWFFDNHPDKCPLASDNCRYSH